MFPQFCETNVKSFDTEYWNKVNTAYLRQCMHCTCLNIFQCNTLLNQSCCNIHRYWSLAVKIDMQNVWAKFLILVNREDRYIVVLPRNIWALTNIIFFLTLKLLHYNHYMKKQSHEPVQYINIYMQYMYEKLRYKSTTNKVRNNTYQYLSLTASTRYKV